MIDDALAELLSIDDRSDAIAAEVATAQNAIGDTVVALGEAVADGADAKHVGALERRLSELRAIFVRSDAAKAILAERRQRTESRLAQHRLDAAIARNGALEVAAIDALRRTLAAADALALAFDDGAIICYDSERLAATPEFRNQFAAHFASAAARPTWYGELNRWRTLTAHLLESTPSA